MKKIFESLQRTKVPRTAFDLSHEVKLTTDLGKITPFLVEEVVPGDKWKVSSEMFVRLMPLAGPMMHRVNIYAHFFFVPNRIIWEEFEDFITNQYSLTVPTCTLDNISSAKGFLCDLMGLPIGYTGGTQINELPFRAYWKIWNEYYRDQNLQTEIDVENLPASWFYPAFRAWEKDYFTSCLPNSQQGVDVQLPIGDFTYSTAATVRDAASAVDVNLKVTDQDSSGSSNIIATSQGMTGTHNIAIKNLDSVNLDINELRKAHRVQRWLEKNMRAGSRYVESLLVHFNVISDDHRMQRPIYLGGGKTPVVISEVLNTSDTTNAVQGEMSGHGIAVGKSNKFSYFVKEHGYIMGLLTIMPVTSYFQGIHKKWSREVATDFYWPEFARLGEQEVLNKEIYHGGTANDDQTFGYQSRYAEYKYLPSRVCGDFKDGLLFWSLARSFATPPSLNSNFITTEQESLSLQMRVFAAGGERESFAVQIFNHITAVRPMPYYADPTL